MRGLYKAKRKDNGEWVEGSLLVLDWESDYVYIVKEFQRASTLPVSVIIADNMVLIDKETICQYIELKDENGKKIWENDILSLAGEFQIYEWKAIVKFGNPNSEYNWGWQLCPIGECEMDKDILLWVDMEFVNCEVVGNIFDNPEMMEGETE